MRFYVVISDKLIHNCKAEDKHFFVQIRIWKMFLLFLVSPNEYLVFIVKFWYTTAA